MKHIPKDGRISLELDKPRTLKFDLKAIEDLEAAMDGRPLGVLVSQLSSMSMTGINRALWIGLRHEDRAMTPNLARKLTEAYLASGGDLAVIARAIGEALDAAGVFKSTDDDETPATEDDEGNGSTAPPS